MIENVVIHKSKITLIDWPTPVLSLLGCSAFPVFWKPPEAARAAAAPRGHQDLIPPGHCHFSASPLCKDWTRGNNTDLPSGWRRRQEAPSQWEILGIALMYFVKVWKNEFSYRIKVSQLQQHGTPAVRSWKGERWERAHCCKGYKGLI